MFAIGKVPPTSFPSPALYFLRDELFPKTWCLALLWFSGEISHPCADPDQRYSRMDLLNCGAGNAISATFLIGCNLIIDVSS